MDKPDIEHTYECGCKVIVYEKFDIEIKECENHKGLWERR